MSGVLGVLPTSVSIPFRPSCLPERDQIEQILALLIIIIGSQHVRWCCCCCWFLVLVLLSTIANSQSSPRQDVTIVRHG